jgi:hypothetical protein
VTVEIDDETYCAAMCVTPPPIDPETNPTATRTGVFQRSFGWLAFTANTYWPASQQPDVFLFSKSQDFWSRFPAACAPSAGPEKGTVPPCPTTGGSSGRAPS